MWTKDQVRPTDEVYVGLIPLGLYRQLARLTDCIDYHCHFDMGVCSGYNDKWADFERLFKNNAGCCCSSCAESFGYWDEQQYIDEVQFKAMDRAFNAHTGFWRPGGCILPRELRGTACLTYNCSTGLTEPESLLLETLRLGILDNGEAGRIRAVSNNAVTLAEKLGIIENPGEPVKELFENVIGYCDRRLTK